MSPEAAINFLASLYFERSDKRRRALQFAESRNRSFSMRGEAYESLPPGISTAAASIVDTEGGEMGWKTLLKAASVGMALFAGAFVSLVLAQAAISNLWPRTPDAKSSTLAPATIDTVRDLKALALRPAMVLVGGYATAGDGGGGQFVWQPSDATAPDDGLVVQPASGPAGRYKRLYSGPVDVRWFGARGDGKTDDTLAVKAAAGKSRSLIFPPGSTFVFRDIVLSNSQTVTAYGAVLQCAPGAAFLFKLTNYAPRIVGAYVGDAKDCSEAALVIDDSKMARIDDFHIIDAINGISIKSTSMGSGLGARRAIISNGYVGPFRQIGLHISRDSSDSTVSNVFLDAGWLRRKPRPGSVGVKLDSTNSITAKGGHVFSNITTINTEVGWEYINAELTKHENCISDGASRYGIKISGESQYLDFGNFFVGTTGNALYVGGTSRNISFTGLRTVLTGHIPPWSEARLIKGITKSNTAIVTANDHGFAEGDVAEISGVAGMVEVNTRQFTVGNVTPNTFELEGVDSRMFSEYRSGGNVSTYFKVAGRYDVVMADAAQATIDAASWFGGKSVHYAGKEGTLILQGARVFPLRTIGPLAEATIAYLTDAGQQANINDAAYVAEEHGAIVASTMMVDWAPGNGQRITYTVMVDGRPTHMAYTIEGSAFGGAWRGDPVPYTKGQSLQIRVETSVGATPARHRGYLSTIPRGG